MKILSLIYLCLCASISLANKKNIVQETKSSYIAVGVAGFKTHRLYEDDLTDPTLGEGAQVNSAWTHLTDHWKIAKRFFLTHKDGKTERREVLEEFDNCPRDLGLIIQANSWGAHKANKLAKEYKRKCGRQVDFFVLVDGISKPAVSSYRREIIADNCLNYYQRQDKLVKGNAIDGCINEELVHRELNKGTARYHIATEWNGMRRGLKILNRYLDGEFGYFYQK